MPSWLNVKNMEYRQYKPIVMEFLLGIKNIQYHTFIRDNG